MITLEATKTCRRLMNALASRARSMGARDPESAAQEAVRRSLERPGARSAIEFYFNETQPTSLEAPDWPLDRLLAWLHGVLIFIVREERSRFSFRREAPGVNDPGRPEHPDPSPGPLEALIEREVDSIVGRCLLSLKPEHRTVLQMRREGLAYEEISNRLGLNVNTVATRVRRGMEELGASVRKRIGRPMAGAVAAVRGD